MAIVVYPLNDIDYAAEDVGIYNSTRTSGIYAGEDFAISMTGSDNTISIDVGLAWMRLSRFFGVAVALKNKVFIDMGIPDSVYSRIDAVVLQFDANKNGAEVVVKPGTASSNPMAPAVSRTEALHELHLLHVLRKPGATSISAADVTDLRMDAQYCGLMADAVTKVDTAAINNQITALILKLKEDLAEVENQTYYASREYVDNSIAATYMTAEVTLSAAGWQGNGPYTQTVAVDGILATDRPHYGVVYSANWEAEKEAFALVDELDTSAGSVTFTCFENKPEVNIVIQMEVNR
jgi:hypothetical protein